VKSRAFAAFSSGCARPERKNPAVLATRPLYALLIDPRLATDRTGAFFPEATADQGPAPDSIAARPDPARPR